MLVGGKRPRGGNPSLELADCVELSSSRRSCVWWRGLVKAVPARSRFPRTTYEAPRFS